MKQLANSPSIPARVPSPNPFELSTGMRFGLLVAIVPLTSNAVQSDADSPERYSLAAPAGTTNVDARLDPSWPRKGGCFCAPSKPRRWRAMPANKVFVNLAYNVHRFMGCEVLTLPNLLKRTYHMKPTEEAIRTPTQEAISMRAYEIFEGSGNTQSPKENWLQAEHELTGNHQTSSLKSVTFITPSVA